MSLSKALIPFHLQGCCFSETLTSDPSAEGIRVLNHLNICTSSSGNSGNTVVICGVQRATRAVDRQRVLILSQNPANDTNQDLPVLLPQQTVDKRVAGCLGIGQAFGGDAPVPGDVYRGQQLHQPEGGVAEEIHSVGPDVLNVEAHFCHALEKKSTKAPLVSHIYKY